MVASPLRKKVAIVGAGPSGLTAARQAQQHGLDVSVFERMETFGGVWAMARAPQTTTRRPVPASSALPISKDLCAFSELPMPENLPTFLRPSDVLAYLHLYVEKFALSEFIRLRAEVRRIERATDWEETGNWQLTWVDLATQQEQREQFHAVLLCTGMRQRGWRPPEWRLEKQFKGRILHAEEFINAADFVGQKVCILGFGNSAAEIASALAHSTEQILLSARRGGWLLNRLCPAGQPWDCHFHTRWRSLCRRFVPKMIRSKVWQWTANSHSLLAVHPNQGMEKKPAHDLLSTHLTFGADQLGWHLACGRIRLKPDIWSLSAGNSVEFVDGTVEEGVDALILCTGYQFDFSFVEGGSLLPVRYNDFHLYKHMFAPELTPHHSLAVIGHVQPVGGCIWPIAELQSRLFFQVLLGHVQLPSPFWMKAELEKRRCAVSVNYLKTRRHSQMEDHVQFCLELASLLGARPPPFHRLLLSDPRLALALWLGPLSPSQFRIWGPFPEEDARLAVLKVAVKNNCRCTFTESWPILVLVIGLFMAILCRFFG